MFKILFINAACSGSTGEICSDILRIKKIMLDSIWECKSYKGFYRKDYND